MLLFLHFQLFLNILVPLFLVTGTASFVVRENVGEEVSEGDVVDLVEKQEVKVTYGDELEGLLRKAASEGRHSLVEQILKGKVCSEFLKNT